MENKAFMKPKLAPTLMHDILYQNLVKVHEHHYEDKTMENLPLGRFYNNKSTLQKKFTQKCTGQQSHLKNGKKETKNRHSTSLFTPRKL